MMTSSAETLTNRLREMILSGELAPGERVTEPALAARLGISRTPLRNVLPGLAAEGLLEIVSRRGFAVKKFSEVESLDALELRAVLEGVAVRRLVRRGAPEEVLAELQRCLDDDDALFNKGFFDREDEQQYGEMNHRFHSIIAEACGPSLLSMMIERLNMVPLAAPSVIVFDQVGLQRILAVVPRARASPRDCGCHPVARRRAGRAAVSRACPSAADQHVCTAANPGGGRGC